MFTPKTDRIEKLADLFPEVIEELKAVFASETNIYIDWQNVLHWKDKLGWQVDAKRLKQFLDSFDTIKTVYLYTGTLEGVTWSVDEIKNLESYGFKVITKPVKKMLYSIDATSIPANSPTLLEPFIKKALLSKLNLKTIEYLNSELIGFNKQGTLEIEDMKCNFDVEIGRDMFLDLERGNADTFILWSGDSDFVDPVTAITTAGKQVFLFATSGRVSRELSSLGNPVFEIRKIKEFICWKKQIPESIRQKIGL